MSDPAKALWSALLNNKNEELSHILQDGADPNMKGGEYEVVSEITPLCPLT